MNNELLIDVNCSDNHSRQVRANELLCLVVRSAQDKEHFEFNTDRPSEQEMLLDSLATIKRRYNHLTGYEMRGDVQVSASFPVLNGIVTPQLLWRFL